VIVSTDSLLPEFVSMRGDDLIGDDSRRVGLFRAAKLFSKNQDRSAIQRFGLVVLIR
jgi:hypothetical protein